jgi:Flp pilus assembly protein CpaB
MSTSKSSKAVIIISIVALLALGLAGYLYYQLGILKQNPQAITQQETEELVAKVSKLIVLPVDEVPTIATVSDPEALKDQAFFAQAEKGDKVLIYAQAKKAILYSVTLNKILEISPLNIGDKTLK